MVDEEIVTIGSDVDIVTARQRGRSVARQLGFTSIDLALITTAISELARNIVLYAHRGEIRLEVIRDVGLLGIQITAIDAGPGIVDVALAMQGGYSTSGGLGLGLPGVRRLMGEIEIVSKPGQGTTIRTRKWKR